ncbi:DUF2568 domain-containing protein [Cytobacillus depressus]|uniref:DUF2568 domain-containing protein n=1 Tax=Cytobacillus depressus TaxID=1602942 RepID=A0A6L3V1P6_9BACI|nr:YrdB family protein [Cytobacillus depressus]KAB2332074.1 DUF2568 domain-containing protein [Cytobacillus depressus]
MIVESLMLVNVAIRFLLELFGLFVYGYWGYKVGGTAAMRWGLAIGIPLIIATAWGLFGSPKAAFLLSGFPHLLLEIGVFLIPAVLLLNLGKVPLALIYGIIVILNRLLMYIWDQ